MSTSTDPLTDITDAIGQSALEEEKGLSDEELEDLQDAWENSPAYDAFLDFLDVLNELKNAKTPTKKHRRMTDSQLDEWMSEQVLWMDDNVKEAALISSVRLRDLWCKDPLLQLDPLTGFVYRTKNSHSRLPHWALMTPSPNVKSTLKDERFLQNYMLVMACMLAKEHDWIAPFKQSSLNSCSVPVEVFTKDRLNLASPDVSDTSGGDYILISPCGTYAYFGSTKLFKRRMKTHVQKAVNRWIRKLIAEDPVHNAMKNWTKIAAIYFKDYDAEGWSLEINGIVESICIAMGGFACAPNLNINYFDSGGWKALASTIDVVNGWMRIVEVSCTLDKNGCIVQLPGQGNHSEWERRFQAAFGGKLSGKTIADIGYGYTKRALTSRLPQPISHAYKVPPVHLFGGLKPTVGLQKKISTEKSATYKPEIIKSRINTQKLPNLSHIPVSLPLPSAQQQKAMAMAQIHEQHPVVKEEDLLSSRRGQVVG